MDGWLLFLSWRNWLRKGLLSRNPMDPGHRRHGGALFPGRFKFDFFCFKPWRIGGKTLETGRDIYKFKKYNI